jgi:3-oxoacyl-(acyl-carrier-protein) synthase
MGAVVRESSSCRWPRRCGFRHCRKRGARPRASGADSRSYSRRVYGMRATSAKQHEYERARFAADRAAGIACVFADAGRDQSGGSSRHRHSLERFDGEPVRSELFGEIEPQPYSIATKALTGHTLGGSSMSQCSWAWSQFALSSFPELRTARSSIPNVPSGSASVGQWLRKLARASASLLHFGATIRASCSAERNA